MSTHGLGLYNSRTVTACDVMEQVIKLLLEKRTNGMPRRDIISELKRLGWNPRTVDRDVSSALQRKTFTQGGVVGGGRRMWYLATVTNAGTQTVKSFSKITERQLLLLLAPVSMLYGAARQNRIELLGRLHVEDVE